jgi:hypothetical protein
MGKIKLLGLLAVSMLALIASVGPSSASAAAQFTAGDAERFLSTTTVEDHLLSVTGAEVDCESTGFFWMESEKKAPEQTLLPSYENCDAFGFAEAIVDTNGCELVLKAETSGEHGGLVLTGCGTGTAEDKTKGIQIEVNVPFFAKCVVDVPEQSIEKAVRYTNSGGGVNIKFTMSNIMLDVTTSTGFCPLTTGTHSGGKGGDYVGESRLVALNTFFIWSDGEAPDTARFTTGVVGKSLSATAIEDHAFSIEGSAIECETTSFSGTTIGKETPEQTLTPTYEDCEIFGAAEATVDTNGCEFNLRAGTSGEHGTLAVTGCGSGTAADKTKGIQVTVNVTPTAHCVVDIPEQSIEKAVRYTNSGGGINIDFTMSNMVVDVTTSTGFCPFTIGTHSGENGYTGESRVVAKGSSITTTEDELAGGTAFTAAGAGEELQHTLLDDHVFRLGVVEIECETIDFTGITTGSSASSLTVSPAYDNCEAFGSAEADVLENGCELTFGAKTTGSPGHANVELSGCGSGTAGDKTKGIQIKVEDPTLGTCIVDIPEQSIGTAVSYTQTTGNSVIVSATTAGIMVDVTTSTGFCGAFLQTGTHSGANGASYTGASTVTATRGVEFSP